MDKMDKPVQVRISPVLIDLIDDLRNPRQSRTEWINRVLAKEIEIMRAQMKHREVIEEPSIREQF